MKESDRDYALDTLLEDFWKKWMHAAATRINPMKTLITGSPICESMKARTMAIARGKHKPAKDERSLVHLSGEFCEGTFPAQQGTADADRAEKPSSLTELATLAGRKNPICRAL